MLVDKGNPEHSQMEKVEEVRDIPDRVMGLERRDEGKEGSYVQR